MDADVLLFFGAGAEDLSLYEALETRLLARYPQTRVQVRKTQISFTEGALYACVSLPRRRKDAGLVVTFGLPYRLEDPRVAVAAEPYPNRWTHHVPVENVAQIDETLLSWIGESRAFSLSKRRGGPKT